MAKTPLTAAVQWNGDGFNTEADIPQWLAVAVGSGKLAFDPPALSITTEGGPVSAAATDWLLLTPDGHYLHATDTDFHANFEIAAP